MIPWAFLIVATIGALFTFNAYLPLRRLGPLNAASFFAGWLTAELSAHHFAWQVVATIGFVAAGALEAWPGWLGLGLTLGSWAGLWALVPIARRSAPALEEALGDALGGNYRAAYAPEVGDRISAAARPRIRIQPFQFADARVTFTRNVSYAEGGGHRNQLDIYAPASGAERAPVLFQVHGGGWVIGNKGEQALPLMNHMAKAGWVCVAANYRLSPKATFPDHLIDLKKALHWVRENIQRFGGDPDFVAVTGGSAGGHLSSMLALTPGDPEYQPGFEHADTSVRAAVPFYGVYDFTDHHGLQAQKGIESFLDRVVMKKKLSQEPEAYRRASPMHRIHPDAPPFFIIHGSHDSLASVEEARHFATLLRETSKAPVAYAEIPGAQHAFEIFHSLRTGYVVQAVDRFLCWAHAGYLRERGLD